MGMTHYWRRTARLPVAMFRTAVADVRRILSSDIVEVAGVDGTGAPVLRHDQIAFNGRMPLACEPFEIRAIEHACHSGTEVKAFCKTEGLPYDLLVKSALIVLAHRLHPLFVVTSDAVPDAWDDARDVTRITLGYGESFTLSTDQPGWRPGALNKCHRTRHNQCEGI